MPYRVFGGAAVVWMLLIGVAGSARANNDEARYLIAGVVEGQRKIETFECMVEETVKFASGDELMDRFVFRFKQGKERLDRTATTRPKPPWTTMAWDGKIMRYLLGEGASDGDISATVGLKPEGLADTPFGDWQVPLQTAMDDALMFYDARVTATEEVDGRECKVIELVPKTPSDQPGSPSEATEARRRLWVAPDRGFSVLRYENVMSNGQLHCRWQYSYGKIGDTYYPESITKEFFDHTDGELASTVTIKLIGAKVNEQLDDAVFQPRFPPGTGVLDRVTGLIYTVGGSGELPRDIGALAPVSDAEEVANLLDGASAEAASRVVTDRGLDEDLTRFEGGRAETGARGWLFPLAVLLGAMALVALLSTLIVRQRRKG